MTPTGRTRAVGERLNARYQDRALVEVWNGTAWSIANVPQPGSVRDMMFGVSALSPSDVWVVGDQEGGSNVFETLAEHWNGHAWSVVPTPDPGSTGNHLYAVDAVSPDNVLVLRGTGGKWTIDNAPNAGGPGFGDIPGGITAIDGQLWLAGTYTTATSNEIPLIEHR